MTQNPTHNFFRNGKFLFLFFSTLFISAASFAQTSIFTTQTPAAVTDNDHLPSVGHEVGMKFTSTAAGLITGVRFYKTSGNTGTHIGELYSSNGTRLAQATFINETATGWQTVSFSSPVAITANTTYTAAYFSSLGNYTEDNNYFKGKSVTNVNLTAPADGTNGASGTDPGNGQGVYKYAGSPSFPNQLYKSANYWVDVVYAASQSGPVANAGFDQNIPYELFISTQGSLDGSASTGNITSYLWSQVSGPTTPSINSPTSATTTISIFEEGTYIFQLSVNGGISIDQVKIIVTYPPPFLSTNGDQLIILPNNISSLNAFSPYRSPTTIYSFLWKQISGPNQSIIDFPTEGFSVVRGLIEGLYVFEVAATGRGGTTKAQIKVKVMKHDLSPNVFTTQIPNEGTTHIGQGIELGMVFRSRQPGYITGIKFYKTTGNTGTHIGELYSENGTKLAAAAFSGESSSGWQTANFISPVKIEANISYTVAYYSSGGNYTVTPNSKLNGVLNNPLFALSSSYLAGPTPSFPTTISPNDENYWVDAIFTNSINGVKADAGPDITIYAGDTAHLDGSHSVGAISNYSWSYITSSRGLITNPTSVSTNVVGLTSNNGTVIGYDDKYVYQLSLNGGISSSQVTVRVLRTAARVGADQTILYPISSTTLDGSASNGKIKSYLWTQLSGPANPVIVNPTSAITAVNGLTLGNYSFLLTLNGDNSTTDSLSIINVRVIPESDSLFSGSSPAQITSNDGQAIELGFKFRSNKAGFVNGIRFYKTTGNTGVHTGELYSSTGTRLAQAVFNNESSSGWQTVTFIPSVAITANTTYVAAYLSSAGNYSATDNYFASATTNGTLTGLADGIDGPNGVYKYSASPAFPTSTKGTKSNYWIDPVFSTVSNQVIANAGIDQTITITTNNYTYTNLDGTGSSGLINSYLWTQISGPEAVSLDPNNVPILPVFFYTAGDYIFQLSLNGNQSTSILTIHVKPESPSIANAGPDQTINFPNNSILIGSYNSDFRITLYEWTQISGPNSAIIESPSSSYANTTQVSGLIVGQYVFQQSINGGFSKDQVTVTVLPSPLPVANAGPNQTITLPVTSVVLDGSGSTGTITGYNWSQISGPVATIITPHDVSPTVTGLVQGTYIFQVILNGGEAPSQITVTVLPGSGGSSDRNIFTTQTPIATTDNDHNVLGGFEAGLKFRSSVAGIIKGIRFYKTGGNSGTHIGELYSSNGTRLAQATFTGETATGWQTVLFSSPVTISANTTYVAAYFSSLGNYVEDNDYFTGAVVNAPLTALADGTDGGNAPYKYASGPSFPNQNYRKANYWVDVIFNTAIPGPIANAGPNQTITLPSNTFTLNGSGSTGAIVKYEWKQISGQFVANISTPFNVTTQVTISDPGIYAFKLSVNDDVSTSTVTITVNPSAASSSTIFTNQVPIATTDNDHQAAVGHEVGVKFTSSVAGYIKGIRFYKTSGNSGTHIGELYSSNGTRLAQATFSGETATGWQTVNFSTPVAITANTTYTAAYFSSLGYYTEDNDYFLHHAEINGNLTAPADGTNGGNGTDPGNGQGVYKYSSSPAFPNQLYRSANYWVDVLFSTTNTGTTGNPTVNSAKAVDENSALNTNYDYWLGQNHPNPVSLAAITKIDYSVPISGKVEIKLFDVQGRQINVLVNETKEAGKYTYELNTGTLAKGVYLYSMRTRDFSAVKKLVVQ